MVILLVFVFLLIKCQPKNICSSFDIDDEGRKKNTTGVQPASKEDLIKVLSNLTSLKIRGEFIAGPDVGSIDNICLYLK
ncbi:MAG: laminin B domain-containing protein [Bacteroidales bacterium]